MEELHRLDEQRLGEVLQEEDAGGAEEVDARAQGHQQHLLREGDLEAKDVDGACDGVAEACRRGWQGARRAGVCVGVAAACGPGRRLVWSVHSAARSVCQRTRHQLGLPARADLPGPGQGAHRWP